MNSDDICNFKPIKNYKLVKAIIPELKTDSGIILKTNKSVILDRPTSGTVITEGPDSKENLLNKKVYFDITSGQDVCEGYIVLKEESILGYE